MPGHEWPWLLRLKPFQEQHGNPTGTVTAVKDGLKPKGGTSRGCTASFESPRCHCWESPRSALHRRRGRLPP